MNTTLNPDTIIAAVKDEVDRRRRSRPPVTAVTDSYYSDKTHNDLSSELDPELLDSIQIPRWMEPTTFIVKETYQLNDFLSLHDECFVDAAYLGLLGRPADADGKTHYLNQLRGGTYNKVYILGLLRFSKEGRKKKTKVRGLLFAFFIQQVYRVPVIGWFAAFVASAAHLPSLAKQFEQFIAYSQYQHRQFAGIINAQASQCETAFRRHRNALQDKLRRENVTAALTQMEQRLDSIEAEYRKQDEHLMNALTQSEQRLSFIEAETRKQDEYLVNVLTQSEQRLDSIEAEYRKQDEHLMNALTQSEQRLSFIEAEYRTRGNELNELYEYFKTSSDPTYFDGSDEFYLHLENRFRGARSDILGRQAVYLPRIERAYARTDGGRVLDIGCGRGEMLELLQQRQINSYGVDISPHMTEICRQLNLNAIKGDAIRHLQSLPENSLGAIVGMHIVEHLPFPLLMTLLREAFRTVKPGGIMIFETPNPTNLIVGTSSFYLDPAHKKPLPPYLLQHLVDYVGFTEVEISYPHITNGGGTNAEEIQDTNDFRYYFYVSMDYAVIANKSIVLDIGNR